MEQYENSEHDFGQRIRRRRLGWRKYYYVVTLVLIVLVAIAAFILWKFIPQETKDLLQNTYLNPDAALDL